MIHSLASCSCLLFSYTAHASYWKVPCLDHLCLSLFFLLQREEALKQHKELSQELVNLRGELGKNLFFQIRMKTDL